MLAFYKKTTETGSFVRTDTVQDAIWIVAEPADDADLEFICSLTGLHSADIADALDYHELPRIEEIHDQLLLFARHPAENEGHHHTIPVTILISPPYFITISPSSTPYIQEIIQKSISLDLFKPSEFLVQILVKITQEFNAQIRKARYSVMAQKKEMRNVTSNDILSLTEQEEILNQYLASLEPLQQTLENLNRIEKHYFHEKANREVNDIFNSIRQCKKLCDVLIKNIRSLRDSYQIIFANKLTKTIQLLTALTIIFSVPNMIASIYGMNVALPLAQKAYAFSALLVIMFFSSVLCGYWFYKKKWM